MFSLKCSDYPFADASCAQAGVTVLFIYSCADIYSFNDAPIFLPRAHWHPSSKCGVLVCLESNYSAEQSGMAPHNFSFVLLPKHSGKWMEQKRYTATISLQLINKWRPESDK